MNALMQKQLQKLFSLKSEIISLLSSYSDEELNSSREPGRWTPAQIASHLQQTESGVILALMRSLKKPNQQKPGLKDFFQLQALLLALKLPFRYKAPKIVANAAPYILWDDLLRSWNKAGISLESTLGQIPESALHYGLFRHPYGALMTPAATINFLYQHMRHHYPQIVARLPEPKKITLEQK